MAPFDTKLFRNKDGIGMPSDDAATDSTSAWTAVALLKGIWAKLNGTITVTTPVGAATSAKQDTGNTALASILAKIIAAPATEAKQDTANTALGTLATQATAAAILAKLIAAPATEAKQDTGNTSLASIASLLTTQAGYLDGLEALIGTTNSKDFATQTTLAALLAKIIAAPSTEAKQDAAITQETAINAVLGTTAGAAVTTSVAGTIQGYLRGVVSLLVSGITVATHAVTQSGTWTVQPGNTANTTAWKVDGSAVTQPVSGTVTATSAGLPTGLGQKTAANSTSVVLSSDGPFATNFGATTDAKNSATDTTSVSAISIWKQISASVQAIATSVAATLAIKHVRSSTGTQSSVAGSAADGTILASNANRLGASVYNDSTAVLYLLLASATSSSTNYSVQLAASAYFEVPANYTGVIKGLWASATGNARVTEYS